MLVVSGMAEGKEETANEISSDELKKIERIRKVANFYYRRKDIKRLIFEEGKNREVVPRYYDGFGRRPDMLNYENDLIGWVDRGATSFHCSEERWSNPSEIKEDNTGELRIGWDLLLDIDCKYLEYSKIAAEVLLEALRFHGINNVGIKFSGGSGFHIGVAFEAFPSKINDIEIRNFFPNGPRIIAAYLKELIKSHLADHILELGTVKEISEKTGIKFDKGFDPFKIIGIDTVLISPRHLFRMPYSLHERTCLASIVINPDQIRDFHPGWANPNRVFPRQFLPKPEKDEAKGLVIQALDWWSKHNQKKEDDKMKSGKKEGRRETILKDVSPEKYPPCVNMMLNGMKQDGRKRALFILLNFLKSMNLNYDEVAKRVEEWNKKNYKPLKEGYIQAQLTWHQRQKPILPPNCDKPYYKDIGVCNPDGLCARIKNPVNYVSAKVNFSKQLPAGGRGKRTAKREFKGEPEFKIMRSYRG